MFNPIRMFGYGYADLQKDIRAYYKFRFMDFGGSYFLDSVHISSPWNLSKAGNVYLATGIIDDALDLTGASSGYTTYDEYWNASNDNTHARSVSMWVYPTATSTEPFFYSGTDGEWTVYVENVDSSTATIRVDMLISSSIESVSSTSGDITLNAWNHVVVSMDLPNSTCKIYVNGVFANSGSDTFTGTSLDDTQNFLIVGGSYIEQDGVFANGRMDEVGCWSTTLDLLQAETLYNGGAGLQFPF